VRTVSGGDELFWALRGGGGGNFGIVTSFTFVTVPTGPFTAYLLDFTPDAKPAILAGWQEWQADVPDEMWSQCRIGGPRRNDSQIMGCFVGPERAAAGMIDDLVRRVGVEPIVKEVKELDFLDAMRFFGGPEPAERSAFVSTSRMLTGPMDPQAMVELLTSAPDLFCLVDSFGGAIARGDGAFPHRDAIGSIQVTNQVPAGVAKARRELAHVREQLGKWFGDNGFVNYLDPEMPDWQQAYYGANAPRLRAVARRHDPDGVFAFAQGLSP
jgi:hypothetical protein